MTRVVLFGASGFLGRQVLAQLKADPRVSDVATPGRARLDLLAASATDAARLLAGLRPDVVLNCVGRLSGGIDELLRGNAGVTVTLIEALAGVAPGARLIRLGSAAEYGPAPAGQAVTEDQCARPVSAYGVSHLAGTRLLEVAADDGRIDGATLRVFNPVGPGITDATVLGRAAEVLRAADGLGPVRFGPLGAVRDFVDVRDVASAVVAAAFAPVLTARVFNVGSGQAVTVRDAVRRLAAELGFSGEIHENARASTRSAEVPWSVADISRARDALGWRPRHTLADSLKGVVAE
ncbi:NAD(P)-dependent oxidoreductase [Streptosporangiaceae bacterium NEAU-GS5]|nr:NAD(P)-dependent oxidoreductase [Streptosporangiaceae bacterium NEAU-GS5]